MRLLVSCPDCKRRYDASAKKPGHRFRCHCGKVLTVKQPEGRETKVIRCSSCGAPREDGRNRCGYCRADFTIHERDRNTVCPQCMARVSDSARFCKHCGTRLSGEQVASNTTQLNCPACGDQRSLVHRQLGHERINVLECSFCAGLWLGRECFSRLEQRARDSQQAVDLGREKLGAKPAEMRKHVGRRYRCCTYCGKMMQRRQYATGSGVVIDICRDHGIWFDDEELQQTLDWIARGGQSDKPDAHVGKSRPKVSDKPVEAAEPVRLGPANQTAARPEAPSPYRTGPATPEDFLGAVVDDLINAFGKWLSS